jgi:hypothetical protein
MKVIFLDIDGVLNCERAYKRGFCKYIDTGGGKHYQSFYPPSKRLINDLIYATDAKIVISSTWRASGLEWMRKVWKLENMIGDIIDITSHREDRFRGLEIRDWLENAGFSHINWSKKLQQEYVDKSGIENYIIIDDDSDMLYEQKDNFVHVYPSPRNVSGFKSIHFYKALKMLRDNIVEHKKFKYL